MSERPTSPHRSGNGMIVNVNPSDISDIVGRYAMTTPAGVEAAIGAAAEAFGPWADATPQERFDVLDRAGTLLIERSREIGTLLSREEGKTLAEGVGETMRAGHIFKFMAGEALRTTGDHIASTRPGVQVDVAREPIGVVGVITPWNFPVMIPAFKIAAALAYGNTVVFKPSELVLATASRLHQILGEAGLPEGAVNLVVGAGEAGKAIAGSSRIAGVTFTGSTATGQAVGALCFATGKKVQLEMGGKNALVILDDADLDIAVRSALEGSFLSAGQRCTASSRLIVQSGIRKRFEEEMIGRMKEMRVGHALDPQTQIGPVADDRQLCKVTDYLEIGRQEAGRPVGGERLRLETDGYFLAPALFTDTDNRMRINREEIFGPVATIIGVDSYEEAEEVANDTDYGLSSGICTTSLKYATRFRKKSRAGTVSVNMPTAGIDYHVPFGGRGKSSYGPREQGRYSIEFYTETKTSYVYSG